MSASQNGWRVIDRDECATIAVPGGKLAVHPLTAPIFTDLAHRYHQLVEPLVWPGCWGYALRPIKGTDVYSNHSSGTAIDLNAPSSPQGLAPSTIFTRQQRSALLAIEDSYGGVIAWGGDWKNPDAMHWEIADGVTVEAVQAVAARLAPQAPVKAVKPSPAPQSTPPAPTGWSGPDAHGSGLTFRADIGDNGPRVKALQQFLARTFPAYAKHLAVDGFYGPRTAEVLREFARRSGIRNADGRNVGPQIARKLTVVGFR